MKRFCSLLLVSFAVAAVGTIALAQNPLLNFGTPQGTNALAASAGFIDILGIKLGMPAEEALATLKKNYPAAKISLERTPDYESAWFRIERENPAHKWAYMIEVDPNGPGDKIYAGLTLPPSKQVVTGVGRQSFLKEPVAVENIVASLRKKYGQETYGVDYRMGGVAPFDGSSKQLLWIFDPQGNPVKPDVVSKNATICTTGVSGDMGAPRVTLDKGRPYDRAGSNNLCWSYVVLNALIQVQYPTQGITGQATSFTVVAFDWPLITSGANALYAFLDQRGRELANKEAQDAKKRGGELKY